MTGQEDKALYIGKRCIEAGMTIAGAAGVLANIADESAFKSTNVEDSKENRLGMNDAQYTTAVDSGQYAGFIGDEAGYGLCQWTAKDRKAGMLDFHRKRGVSIGDFKTQVEWMLTEIRGYSKAWEKVKSSASPYDCGYYVCKYYEIPANTEATAESRGGSALGWFGFLTQALDAGAESTISTTPASPDPEPQELDEDGVPVPKTWPPRMIDEHCSAWPEVKLLQAALACRGYSVTVDGLWSKSLTEKVKAFQSSHNLTPVDGVVGPMTWACILYLS